jgi:hypothetical protein
MQIANCKLETPHPKLNLHFALCNLQLTRYVWVRARGLARPTGAQEKQPARIGEILAGSKTDQTTSSALERKEALHLLDGIT